MDQELRFVARYLDGACVTFSTAVSVLYSPWIANPQTGPYTHGTSAAKTGCSSLAKSGSRAGENSVSFKDTSVSSQRILAGVRETARRSAAIGSRVYVNVIRRQPNVITIISRQVSPLNMLGERSCIEKQRSKPIL